MSKSKNKNKSATAVTSADKESPEAPLTALTHQNWITDRAWISGVVGAVAVVACAIWYSSTDALTQGVFLFGWQVTDNRIDSLLAALTLCSVAMVLVEMVRLWLRNPQAYWQIAPELKKGQYFPFFVTSLFHYLLYLALLGLVIAFFHSANEYGYQKDAPFYRPWFRFLELAWSVYLWAGLPYTLITRALKHDPAADRRDLTAAFAKVLHFFATLPPMFRHQRPRFDEMDKKIGRGLLVKLFFAPLMTVFFADQFPHLISNVGYLVDGLPSAIANNTYTHQRFNNDFFNISIALIFSIDVALAWCGYIVASRWVDNQTISAEPTMLGWIVCIACYPPFQMMLGLYYTAPGERAVLQLGNLWFVTIFTAMMVFSYFVYMAATLWFGVRFSNLTNRGIIRKGPFAYIRHPAYASKNFAWWCVMFPVILYNATHDGMGVALFQIMGLILMTTVYYLRAMTEERHLMVDPYYQAYCKQVKYRFIPGVL